MPNSPVLPNGHQQLAALQLKLSDDALVVFGQPVGSDGVSFHDSGFMPVNETTIAGKIPGITPLLSVAGLNGMFIQYASDGVQHFANGLPTTADYTSLHYQLIGYTGHATFSHAADGTPTVSGLFRQVVLAQGDLISGHVAFNASGGLSGELDASMRIGGLTIGSVSISVQHSAADIGHTATGGLTLSNGAIVGTFVPL